VYVAWSITGGSMRRAAAVLAALCLVSCKGEVVHQSRRGAPAESGVAVAAAEVPTVSWASLAHARIYFGHQSVGRNVIEGLRELNASEPGNPVTFATLHEAAATPDAPLLAEFAIGENGKPETKMQGFAAALDSLPADARGVAMFKYCFLDITAQTDAAALFARHQAAVAAMRARHPGLTWVHVTAPLTVDEPASRRLVKSLLGKPTARDANARRSAFNALLRRAYAGEPMLDLARLESTRPDGSRTFVMSGRDTVYVLAPELTDDGGHLNATGRRIAAAEFANVVAAASRSEALAIANAPR
jgi:hypothetical protein